MIKVAIYSGKIPGPSFIENLIKLIGDNNINIYLFGSGSYVKYKNSNIKSYHTPQGKIKIVLFVFSQLLSLFVFHPKKFYKLLCNYSTILKSGSVFISLSKILPVLNHTPDIFHIQWAKSLPFWFFLKQIYGIKIILSLRGSHINYSPYADNELAEQYKKLFPKVDKMHAVSKKISLKANQFGAKEDRIERIYSALDVNLLKTFEKTDYAVHEPFRFLSVGRFHWVKGYQYSIKAIAGLKKLNRKIHYTIVANNNISEEILYQIDELSLNNYIKIIHPNSQHDVYNIMSKSDCFILPSVQEGISNVVLEAMAIGLPIITSDCGGMKEIINNGKNGLYFPARDSEALEKLLYKLMNYNFLERKKIITQGKKYIKENLDPKLIKSAYHNFYISEMEVNG